MNETEWIPLISNMGFPIAITVYLLLRFEKKIDTLKESIDALVKAIRESRG